MVAVVCSLKGNPLSFEGFLKLAGGAISSQMPRMALVQVISIEYPKLLARK
jgi:hypothetical protein